MLLSQGLHHVDEPGDVYNLTPQRLHLCNVLEGRFSFMDLIPSTYLLHQKKKAPLQDILLRTDKKGSPLLLLLEGSPRPPI